MSIDYKQDPLKIENRSFDSRLIVALTDFERTVIPQLIDTSGCEIVTHTINATNVDRIDDVGVTHKDLVGEGMQYVPNTHGCKNAGEAIDMAKAIRRSGLSNWIKLEISPSERHFMPDAVETLKAAEWLVKEGFTVLPYIHADPVLAKKLEEVGCATVMPLGAPIGTGKGLKARDFLGMLIEDVSIPVIVDAGLGLPSHAAECMELGVDAVIVHTAILYAEDQLLHANAFRLAVEAGRQAWRARPNVRRGSL